MVSVYILFRTLAAFRYDYGASSVVMGGLNCISSVYVVRIVLCDLDGLAVCWGNDETR